MPRERTIVAMAKRDTEIERGSAMLDTHAQVLGMSFKQLSCAHVQMELNLPIPMRVTFLYFLLFFSLSASVHPIEAKDDTNVNNALYRLSRD